MKGKKTLAARVRQYRKQPRHLWKDAKPVAAAGAIMIGAWEVFEGLEAIFDKLVPVAGNVAGPYGAWFVDHLTTLVQVGFVPYFGYQTYRVFKQPMRQRKARKGVTRKHRKTDWKDLGVAWQRIKPVAYAGCIFFGVQETLDAIATYVHVALPVSWGFRPGTFLFENWASILKTALSGYAAYRGWDRFRREADSIRVARPLRPRAGERQVDKVRRALNGLK